MYGSSTKCITDLNDFLNAFNELAKRMEMDNDWLLCPKCKNREMLERKYESLQRENDDLRKKQADPAKNYALTAMHNEQDVKEIARLHEKLAKTEANVRLLENEKSCLNAKISEQQNIVDEHKCRVFNMERIEKDLNTRNKDLERNFQMVKEEKKYLQRVTDEQQRELGEYFELLSIMKIPVNVAR